MVDRRSDGGSRWSATVDRRWPLLTGGPAVAPVTAPGLMTGHIWQVQMAEGLVPGIFPEGSRSIRGMLSLVDPAGIQSCYSHANHWRWRKFPGSCIAHAPPQEITNMPLDLEL
ncbi:hypothetical protein Tco_1125571 [Tanacetum coccineum]|uniref:Uncharacterized protein n=1 Tax=Tanacetum coccineum TaxID=301880 RepID=A0ABQ5JAH8_9ASTR